MVAPGNGPSGPGNRRAAERYAADTARVWFVPQDTPYFYWLIPESSDARRAGTDRRESDRNTRQLPRTFPRKAKTRSDRISGRAHPRLQSLGTCEAPGWSGFGVFGGRRCRAGEGHDGRRHCDRVSGALGVAEAILMAARARNCAPCGANSIFICFSAGRFMIFSNPITAGLWIC